MCEHSANNVQSVRNLQAIMRKAAFASGLGSPAFLLLDDAGNLFESDAKSGTIFKFSPSGMKTTFASGGLTSPTGLAFDVFGNLYEADQGSGTIFKFNPSGMKT